MVMSTESFKKLLESITTDKSDAILDLQEPELNESQVIELAKALEKNTCVRSLILNKKIYSNNKFGVRAAIALANMLKVNDSIRSLSLTHNDIGDEGVAIFAEAGIFEKLCSLDLSYNAITDGGMEILAKALDQAKPSNLYKLFLAHNQVHDKGALSLASVFAKSQLQIWDLDLAFNEITAKGAKAIFDALPKTKLRRVSLEGNYIGNEGITYLAPVSQSLVYSLNLSSTNIDDKGGCVVALLIQSPSPIRHLKVCHNALANEGAAAFAAVLRTGSPLLSLDCSGNHIDEEGIDDLIDAAKNGNNHLHYLGLNDNNDVSTTKLAEVIPSYQENQKKTFSLSSEIQKTLDTLYMQFSQLLGEHAKCPALYQQARICLLQLEMLELRVYQSDVTLLALNNKWLNLWGRYLNTLAKEKQSTLVYLSYGWLEKEKHELKEDVEQQQVKKAELWPQRAIKADEENKAGAEVTAMIMQSSSAYTVVSGISDAALYLPRTLVGLSSQILELSLRGTAFLRTGATPPSQSPSFVTTILEGFQSKKWAKIAVPEIHAPAFSRDHGIIIPVSSTNLGHMCEALFLNALSELYNGKSPFGCCASERTLSIYIFYNPKEKETPDVTPANLGLSLASKINQLVPELVRKWELVNSEEEGYEATTVVRQKAVECLMRSPFFVLLYLRKELHEKGKISEAFRLWRTPNSKQILIASDSKEEIDTFLRWITAALHLPQPLPQPLLSNKEEPPKPLIPGFTTTLASTSSFSPSPSTSTSTLSPATAPPKTNTSTATAGPK